MRIVVVGAGAFGGWAALEMLRRGAEVTLVDTWGPGNARASSGGETRVIRAVYGPDRVYVRLVRRAFELWRENQRRWNSPLYHRSALLWLFSGPDHYAKTSLPLLEEFGFRLDPVPLDQLRARYPQIGLSGVASAYLESEAGYLSARQACQRVCDEFRRCGGTYIQLQARPGTIAAERIEHIELGDGAKLPADRFVFACGPWLGEIFPEILADLIKVTRQEVYFFGTPSGEPRFDDLPIWIDVGDRIFYGIPCAGQRGFKLADDTRGAVFDPTRGDRTPTPEGLARAREFLARRFPALRDAPLLESRVCQYANTPDGHLLFDRHPQAHNVWLLGGGSGHGFKLGPALAELVADCVLDGLPGEPLFSLGRLGNRQPQTTQFEHR